MLLIGISTLCIALIPFFLVFLRLCDRSAILKGVFEHLLLLQRPEPPQTPCRTFWHGKQTISPYTTNIVDTLFEISNHSQSLEKNSMHCLPIIHTYHLSSTCLRSLASVWIGLWTLFFSIAKLSVTILWLKWRPKQANPIEECRWTPSSYLQHTCWQFQERQRSKQKFSVFLWPNMQSLYTSAKNRIIRSFRYRWLVHSNVDRNTLEITTTRGAKIIQPWGCVCYIF